MPFVFRAGLTGLAAAALLGAAAPALAHAHLHMSDPAANATVAAPKVLHLMFSEKLEAKFSTVEVAAAGKPVAVTVKASGETLEATPKSALKAGAYTVTWKVLSVDGHKSQGSYSFTVK